jgi:hypothetical protein
MMKTILDEILITEFSSPGKDKHTCTCGCASCREKEELDLEALFDEVFNQELNPVLTTPTPGAFYQIKRNDNLLTVVGKAYIVGAGDERLKLAQMVNNDPRNRKFWISPNSSFSRQHFKDGVISFSPRFTCGEDQRVARGSERRCYARIFISATESKPNPIVPPTPHKNDINFTVPGIIPVITQPSSMTCWATVFTMMYSWKNQQSVRIEDAVRSVGNKWLDLFRKNKGLSTKDKIDFIKASGLNARMPMSLSIEGWLDILKKNGPVWVTTNETPGKIFSIHARIIKGIKGNGTPPGTKFLIIDPAGGKVYEERFDVFINKYEDEARDKNRPLRIQILHW